MSADLAFLLVISYKLIIYFHPSASDVPGVLEGLYGCSVWGCSCKLLEYIVYFLIFFLIQKMRKVCSSDELVFDLTMLHPLWSSILECSNVWYYLISLNLICQRGLPCSHLPVSIVCESFCTFGYCQNLRDLGDFVHIPIFLFLGGLSLKLKFIHY